MPLKESRTMWCLVASAGTKIRWGKRQASWAGTCALLKAAQRLEKKAQRLSGCTWCWSSCPRLTLGCLKVSTASMPEVTVLWEKACRRDYVGIDLLGVETDLWALWKFRYQSFWDKLCLPEMCLNLKVKKIYIIATSLRFLPGPFIAWLPLYWVWLPNICRVSEITQYC